MSPPSAIDQDADILPLTDTEGISIQDALTVTGISSRRKLQKQIGLGIAAYGNSDFFKHDVSKSCSYTKQELSSVRHGLRREFQMVPARETKSFVLIFGDCVGAREAVG